MALQSFCNITTEEPCNTPTMSDYSIPASSIKDIIEALINEGSNGGIIGKDMKFIGYNQDG